MSGTVVSVDLFKLFLLCLLSVEELDNGNPTDMLLNKWVHPGDLIPYIQKGHADFVSEPESGVEKYGKNQNSHNRKFPAHHQHKVEDKEDPEQIANHIHHSVGEQLTQGFNIAGCSGNQPADRSFVKKLNVQ